MTILELTFCRQSTDRCLALPGTMIASASCTVELFAIMLIYVVFFQLQKLMLPPAAQSQAVLMLPPQIPAVVDVPFLGAPQPCKASQSATSNVSSPHNGLGHALLAYNMHSHSYCVCRQCPRRLQLSVLPVNTMGATWTIVVWYYHVYKLPGKDNWAVDDWDVSNQDNAFGQ